MPSTFKISSCSSPLTALHSGRILFDRQQVHMQVAPLAAAFVGYVVFWNLSLQVNSVGFYQLSKIMVLPTVAALEVRPMPAMHFTSCSHLLVPR